MRSPAIYAALLCLTTRLVLATDVLAHFMMQNAWSYTGAQWIADIQSAKEVGIDGFILNVIPPNCVGDTQWQFDRAYEAYAIASYLNFKMMLSIDMSYSSCTEFWTPQVVFDKVAHVSSLPSAYRWNTNILVTTFGGTYPQYGNSFFQQFKDIARNNNFRVTLAPALTDYSNDAQWTWDQTAAKLMTDYPAIDGFTNWQAWPLDTQHNMTTVVDQAFQNKIRQSGRTGPYIMSISPWQYKDLNTQNAQDSWVQYSDYLFPTRWQSIVGPNAFTPDIVQILTWNDWGESHYLRNLPSTDPLAPDYVNLGSLANYVTRMNHAPWRTMATYYISWLKNGSPPSVSADQVVVWYRTHPKGTPCASGASVPIRNAQLVGDSVFMWAVVAADSQISTSIGSSKYVTFPAKAGAPVMGNVPFPSEVWSGTAVTPEVAVVRNGGVTQVNKGSHTISTSCSYENYNPEVFLVGPGPNF